MGAARLRRARGGGPGARRHPRRDRADAGAARDALPPRQPHAAVAPRHGGRARDGNERARRRRPAAAQRLARGRPAGIPPVARAPEPVRTRVQARGRARGRGLGRREPAARAGPVAARRNEPPGGRRLHPGRSHHRRHAQGCGAVARRLAGYAHSRQGRRSGRAGRQPGGRHRRDPAHRVRHDTRTHRQTRFAEENVDKIGLAFVAAAIIAACGKGETGNEKRGYDLVLKNGWIVDGSGNPRYRGDVAVRGDRIAAVGFLGGAQARETLDVAGLVVAPGFIDMMGQSEINALIDNRVFSKITQGITTEVTGEGGSVAPLTDQLVRDDSDAMKKWHYREDWRDLDGYFAQLAKQGAALNIATFVGATQVRLAVVGKANRAPTAAELERMTALVDTLMRQGALNELFQIARDAGIPAEVSHLKVSGRKSWGQMPRILARIDSARAAGLDVTADQYPYTRAATALDASIPSWAESGGLDSLLARLRDPATRAGLRDEMVNPKGTESFYYEAGGGAGVLITGTFQDSLRYLQGKTVGEIAAQRHRDPVETLFDIVLAEQGHRTDAVYAVMSEPDVQAAMKTWWVAVNTDFGGVAPDGPFGTQSAHPRAYGTFARILGHYARDLKLFPLEFAVRKMTSLAAQRVGLSDRGLLKAGMAADITVFDPAGVADKATFEQPHQPSVGFAYVFVNGQKVLDHGKLTAGRPGRGLRGPGYVAPEARGTQ